MIGMPVVSLARWTVLVAMAAWLGGCAGVVVGAGAATGIAASQERGLPGAARDLKIEAQIADQWFRHDHTFPTKLGIEVHERRVLLTGVVEDPGVRADAVRLAWQVEGIKEIINEIKVAERGDVVDFARDSWITTQLKSKLTLDKRVEAINYAIETVNGTIYLIGVAQSQEELDRVIAHARTIEYVRRIASHVRVKDGS